MSIDWRRIGIGFVMFVLCLAATTFALRATAQSQSAEEESATIKDDPTIAPDANQSADNNVSFPTDI